MCGIAGILRFDGGPASEPAVAAMCVSLAHRGPDGEGRLCRGPVGLGHRRLAIIDPAGGRQPLSNEDEQVAVSANGEIYNYRECVEHFRGMFAFALADWRQGVLFLARDHLGIKPLHYARADGLLAFASELQAFRETPEEWDSHGWQWPEGSPGEKI